MKIYVQLLIEFVLYMSKIGMIGTTSFTNRLPITNIFSSIKRKYGQYVEIISGGNSTGAELLIKKYALELGYPYKEYNPSYTGWRIYSAMPKEYYGKGFHPSHLTDRYKKLVTECEYLIIFIERGLEYPSDILYAIKYAQKLKKKFAIITS